MQLEAPLEKALFWTWTIVLLSPEMAIFKTLF